MPAINLSRLQAQMAHLKTNLDDAERFFTVLRDMLDFYSNRTARALPRPGDYLPSLHTPPQVLREIELALAPLAQNAPRRVMPLIIRLWKENLLEAHLLAAYLLGHIPPDSDNWMDVVTAWLNSTRDPRVRLTLLEKTLRPLRQNYAARYLHWIKSWLAGDDFSPSWDQALTALIFYVQEAGSEDLPPVFPLLAPVLPHAQPKIQRHLVELLTLLYRKSPAETRYFLQKALEHPLTPEAQRTLRRMAALLPDDLRIVIRQKT